MYASGQKTQLRDSTTDVPTLPDPALLRAARTIYRTYRDARPSITQRPAGVVLHRTTHRGVVVFGDRPVLLPPESFVPFNLIEETSQF